MVSKKINLEISGTSYIGTGKLSGGEILGHIPLTKYGIRDVAGLASRLTWAFFY